MDEQRCMICLMSKGESSDLIQQECCKEWLHEGCKSKWEEISESREFIGGCPNCRAGSKLSTCELDEHLCQFLKLVRDEISISENYVFLWYRQRYAIKYKIDKEDFDLAESFAIISRYHELPRRISIEGMGYFEGPCREPLFLDIFNNDLSRCDYTLLKIMYIAESHEFPTFTSDNIEALEAVRGIFEAMVMAQVIIDTIRKRVLNTSD